VKRVLGIFLGILTAIGGFVDMGDLVANAAVGARFDMNLAWVVVVGVVGIVVYAQMAAALCSTSCESVSARGSAWRTSSLPSPSTC